MTVRWTDQDSIKFKLTARDPILLLPPEGQRIRYGTVGYRYARQQKYRGHSEMTPSSPRPSLPAPNSGCADSCPAVEARKMGSRDQLVAKEDAIDNDKTCSSVPQMLSVSGKSGRKHKIIYQVLKHRGIRHRRRIAREVLSASAGRHLVEWEPQMV